MPAMRGLVVVLALALAGPVAATDPAPYDELPPDRVLYVAPGQTLDELVRRAYRGRDAAWAEIRSWIVEHNPHAFVGGDPSQLRGDVRLRLPSASEFARRQQDGRVGAEEFRLAFDERYLFVNPSQSLADLVPRVYPQQRERWGEIIEAIQRENGRTFEARDAREQIARGTRLRIPSVVETAAATRRAEPVVGRATEVSGDVSAVAADGERRALSVGDPVRRSDRIETGAGAQARIEMVDGERIDLRPDSRVRVREWLLPDTGPGQRVVELIAGGLRAITGALGNRSGDDYRTITSTATMGVRGTDYALRMCDAGGCRDLAGEPVADGLYVAVAAGEVELLNAAGEQRFAAGQYGFVADSDAAPVVIEAAAAPEVYPGDEGPARDGAAAEDDGGTPWWPLGLLIFLL